MKKLVVFTLVLLLVIPGAAGMAVSVNDAEGAKGGTVEVPVNLKDASAIGSMDIVLKYDPAVLRAIAVEGSGLGENAYLEANTARNGEVIIALADSRGINGEGAVALITFEVLGNIGSASYLTFEKVSANNIDLTQISTTTKDGTLKVTSEATPKSDDSTMAIMAITAIIIALFLIRGKK